jgi:hypothetical protein
MRNALRRHVDGNGGVAEEASPFQRPEDSAITTAEIDNQPWPGHPREEWR